VDCGSKELWAITNEEVYGHSDYKLSLNCGALYIQNEGPSVQLFQNYDQK